MRYITFRGTALRAAAQDAQPPLEPDTLDPRAPGADRFAVAGGATQDTLQDSTAVHPTPTLRLGLAALPLPYQIDLASRLPDPQMQRPELRTRVRPWSEVWAETLNKRLAEQRMALWTSSRPLAGPAEPSSLPDIRVEGAQAEQPGAGAAEEAAELEELRQRIEAGEIDPEEVRGELEPDARVAPPPPPPVAAPVDSGPAPQDTMVADGVDELLPDAVAQYTDLGIILQGRVELGGGWSRTRPCNVTIQLNCNVRLIPDIQPDIQFGARLGGTISERIHVGVDYDNRREFDAANNINVFYQGLSDEIIQRVEVGDVTFPLPQSRFLTRGIPAGNFGFHGTGQVGPIDFQAVWAQQKGDLGTRELQLGGGGQGFEQQALTVLDDAAYERGRFFFLFNPRRFSSYPHIDPQRLIASDAPPDIRPGSAIKLYRYEGGTVGRGSQIPEGFITAIAGAEDTLTISGADTVVADTLSGLFRPLVEGEDYILHQSGTWILLRNTVPDAQALAVTYIADDGTEIGTFNAEEVSDAHSADPDNVDPPTLELIKDVNHRPRRATWLREMHNVYRISASPGVVESSVRFVISQGDPQLGITFRTAGASQLEFIKIFGLDDNPTDNKIDESVIYEAQGTGADATAGPAGTYIMFPTLEPFRAPPPLQGVEPGLDGLPFPLAGGDKNEAIYNEENDQIRRGSNLYLLTINYLQRFEGFVSTISLGAGGVREGSERVFIEDVELVRGEDYTIDYDVGQVELREPDRWFRNTPSANVRVTFEQKPLFQLAPTSVFGFQARYGLGRAGELSFIGLSQNEKTLQTRPELGLEPSSVQMGGLSGRLNFEPRWLTNFMDALPGVRADAPSTLSIDGELAASLPTTNTQGVTYVEDFEGGTGFRVATLARAWRLGAAPTTNAGAETIAPVVFDESNASELVWQDQYVVEGGQIVGGIPAEQIDDQIRVQGANTAEPVLWISAKNPEDAQIGPGPNPPSGPTWRSITANLSLNGTDFTTIEFLEFYIGIANSQADSVSMLVDLGTVSEDAFAFDSLRVPSGIGVLNREAEPPRVWSNIDDIGLWGTGCEAESGVITYPLRDVRANCTRSNGLEDSEDLNQNNVLDSDERYFRYTVELGDQLGPYFVRDANNFAGFQFKLYRIPLRRPDHKEQVTDPDFQNVKHLRLTFLTRGGALFILARPNFLGSRFLKRGNAGVVAGQGDTISAPAGSQSDVGPISTLDARYVPPPGISDQIADQSDQFTIRGSDFNEQSLSISFNDLPPDHRAEAYLQYTQTPRDFLQYRGLRVWGLGIDGPWGEQGSPLRFFVKLGESATNFYLYRTPLKEVPPGAGGNELRAAWLPEIRIDMDRFIALRTRAEEILFSTGGVVQDSLLQVWDTDVFPDGDSTYAVFITQRSRAPNLAAVRQISLGVYNAGSATVSAGEVWVDDIRLDRAVDNSGLVGHVNLNLAASDVAGLYLTYTKENPYFRQLAAVPSFRSGDQLRVGGRLELGRFLPSGWALRMPMNVRYANADSRPIFLPRTDIFSEDLAGLRAPSTRDLGVDFTLSRQGRSRVPKVGWLVDNSSLRFSFSDLTLQNSRSLTESNALSAGYSFRSGVFNLSIPIFKPLVFLPRSVRDSPLRLTPQSLQLTAAYVDSEALTSRFAEVVGLPSDSAVVPIKTLDQRLQNLVSMDLAPFSTLTGNIGFTQDRELLPADVLVQGDAAQEILEAERSSFAGLDLGWMRGRTLNTNLSFRPDITGWLTLNANSSTRFRFNRSASFITEIEGDTVLTSDYGNGRSVRTSVSFNLPSMFNSFLGSERTGLLGSMLSALGWIDILTATYDNSLATTFNRGLGKPDFGYQLGLGSFSGARFAHGDTASRVIETDGVTLSSGLQFPVGLGFTVDYANLDGSVWTPVNQTDNKTRTWPSYNLIWNRIPVPGFLRRWVQSFGFRAGYNVRTVDRVIVGADQDRMSRTENIPLSVNLALTTGWALNYNFDTTDEIRFDPTGQTLGDNRRHAVQLTGQIALPQNSKTFRNPLRISLRVEQTHRDECRRLGAGGSLFPPSDGDIQECQPYTDIRIRRVDLTADTDVQPFVLGFQGSWRDTQSELGQRPGSTQLEISLFGQFQLELGEIR